MLKQQFKKKNASDASDEATGDASDDASGEKKFEEILL